ncbi:MAG: hypothetical protein J4O03_08780 [Chloroflexi bacterium]|nr:hypothetical protein [Chloroflexota bacterium]MCH8351385.1 hypothetical protein [Chloroflexota bacterium]MCI0780830.1 hypothetical protein [Chloroflexota bacterium]MCI0786139.1 hypothetical protein [Chloroflexota bacterium]MCI0793546.1 hypothetical protein [Chloroflexota bacterium]
MPDIADEGLKRAILRLMELMVEDGRCPEDATALVNGALDVWEQDHPRPEQQLGEWRHYAVDNYKFRIRRNLDGQLEIGREEI